MKKKIVIITMVAIILAIILVFFIEKQKGNTATKSEKTNNTLVVPTMNDKITEDSSWCGTFQLVWNDFKNEVVKKDIVFTPQLEVAENLNKEDFNTSMLSDDYYFKIYGLKTLDLKEKIEKGIKEKFNQTSSILNDFDWSSEGLDNPNSSDERRYFLYAMLYRKFEFLNKFDKLENGKFGNKYNNIQYFGIDKNTSKSVGKQIRVLYYHSKDDFAVLVNTKTDDEVIFCKSPKGNTFNEIYKNMNTEADNYTGSKAFNDADEFKAPNLTFNDKKIYSEFENKIFPTGNPEYPLGKILKAIQTISFSLDENGGKIKSEAGIDGLLFKSADAVSPEENKPRYFYVDNTFAIFLRQKGKEKPYFAGRIDDITKFQ